MPALKNPRHEMFAQECARGKSPVAAAENSGFSPDRSIASGLRNMTDISERILELTSVKTVAKTIEPLTKDWVLGMLMRNATRAMEASVDKGGSIANRALHLLGTHLGLFVERSEQTVLHTTDLTRLSDDELATLESLLNKSADSGPSQIGTDPTRH